MYMFLSYRQTNFGLKKMWNFQNFHPLRGKSIGWTVSWCISLLVHWLVPIYFWSNLASYRYASGQMSVMRWFCSFRMFWASIEGLSFVRFMQIFSFILRLSLDRNMKLFNLQSNSNDQCVNTFFVIFGQIQLL